MIHTSLKTRSLKNNYSQIAKTKKIALFLYAILTWFGLDPYLLIGHELIVILLLYSSFIFLIIFIGVSYNEKNRLFFVLFFVISFYFMVPGIGSANQNLGFGFIPISFVFLLSEEHKIILLKYFKTIFVLSLIPGFVIYIFDIVGFHIPYRLIKVYTNNIPGYSIDYIGFMGNMKSVIFESINIYRFQGMYPEPGTVGTISAMFLILSEYRIKDKQNLLLLIFGVFSLSLAFFIMAAFYYILRAKKGYRNILLALSIIILIFIIPATKYFIVNRFIIVNHALKANNRVSYGFSSLYKEKIESGTIDKKLFGYGADAHASSGYGVSSYKCIVYNKGYFGLFILIAFYLLYLFKNIKNSHSRLIMIIILSSIYQRPDVMTLFFVIIFSGGVALLSDKEKDNLQEKMC